MCSICTNETRRTNNQIWGHWRYRILETWSEQKMMNTWRCQSCEMKQRGSSAVRPSWGLLDWLVSHWSLSPRTLYQPVWLQSTLQHNKKCLLLKDSGSLRSWVLRVLPGASLAEPVSLPVLQSMHFNLPKCLRKSQVVPMCQMSLWKNNFSGIVLHSQWGRAWDRQSYGWLWTEDPE